MPNLRVIYFTSLLIICVTGAQGSDLTLVPDKTVSRWAFYDGSIIFESDSLFLNNIKLKRGVNYSIDYIDAVVLLNDLNVKAGDTLHIFFDPLPSWLDKMYGNKAIPTSKAKDSGGRKSTIVDQGDFGNVQSKLLLNGAKRFSVFSETNGSSKFDQSLELNIKGELSPGLEISGAIADQQYKSQYGTINSTIDELDRIIIKIKSKEFESEIGDLEIRQKSENGQMSPKQVTGIQAHYHTAVTSALVTVARPRGRFETASFSGRDFVQGPYRISSRSQIIAIVPGSERVWVNGQLLENGADKDYFMDYPAASITFMPRIIIDSRSRIEIDFEPLTEDFQREYYRFQSGLALSDSMFASEFTYLHEGDNKDRLKIGDLTPEDKNVIADIGDNIVLAFEDGVMPDSAGDYVERFDAEGNRYFEYAGEGLGEYSIDFSSAGENRGDYIYLGNDEYRYVGAQLGNYISKVPIPVPSKLDYFDARLTFRPANDANVSLVARQSIFDRNLFSELDDADNRGGQYSISAQYGAYPTVYSPQSGGILIANMTESNFKSSGRRIDPDRSRKYLIPDSLKFTTKESEITGMASVHIPFIYSAYLSSGMLNYSNLFGSGYGELSLYPDKRTSILPVLSYRRLRSQIDSSAAKFKGRGDKFSSEWNYSINELAELRMTISSDRRTNRYMIIKKGTTERLFSLAIKRKGTEIRFERYDEDTLVVAWQNRLRRERLTLAFGGMVLGLKSDLFLAVQKFRQDAIDENQLMARLKYSWTPKVTNISVSGSYSLSDENRYERGLRYLEVEPGLGQFVYEDSQYIPDPNGNYIEIEEILSNQASVKKGERSFSLLYNPKDIYLRFNTNFTEDLLSDGERGIQWIIPFYADPSDACLYKKLYYSGESRLFRNRGFYLINLAGSYNLESRQISGRQYEKYERIIKTELHESRGSWHFLQEASYFEYQRDNYYNSPGNIRGYNFAVSLIRHFSVSQLNVQLSYRSARDNVDSRSKQYGISINPVLRSTNKGETIISIMTYRQELENSAPVSYRLTNNLSGKRGVVWSLRSEYRMGGNLKFILVFDGRHANDKRPRIAGRGELIASF